MTSIERAKSFILGKGRAIALTLVPLAALATIHVPARAGTVGPATPDLVLDTTSCNVGLSGGAGSGSCTIAQLRPAGGATGVTLSGAASGSSVNSGGAFTIDFFASGGANGASYGPGSMPLHFDFIVSNSDGNPVDFALLLQFQTNLGLLEYPFSGSTSGEFGENTSANFLGSVMVESYSIDLTVTDPNVGANGTTMSVDVPAGRSLDLNLGTSNGSPEPSTLALVGSAIAGLMFWRKRKKA